MQATNITELAQFFPAATSNNEPKVIRIVPCRKGETLAQATERRAATARRIEEKLKAKRG